LAARAAHWSARHRKTAIFGWLAFVVIAAMKLLGQANWYLPERLNWLPRFEHEPSVLAEGGKA
jgi:hypothetical protein